MFSPLNIIIKPSAIERWFYVGVHLLALLAISYAAIAIYYQLLLAALVSASAVYDYVRSKAVIRLFWEVDQQIVKVAFHDGAFELCASISELYLVFGILYLRLNRENKPAISVFIFPDSVDKKNYRRLKVAATWGRLP
ncbi:protein YgfX [Gammaproteobacteria bacterium AS21]